MSKTKSIAAYTNKWLYRHQHQWHVAYINNNRTIVIDILDAPKIVLKRIKEINDKHCVNNLDSEDSVKTSEPTTKIEAKDNNINEEEDYIDYDEYDMFYVEDN